MYAKPTKTFISSNLWTGFKVVDGTAVVGIVVVLVSISLVKIGMTSVVLCITAGWNLSSSCHKPIFLSKALVVDLLVTGSSGISNWVVFKVVVVSTIGRDVVVVVVWSTIGRAVVVVGTVVLIVVVRTVVGMDVVVVVVGTVAIVVGSDVVVVGKAVVVVGGKVVVVVVVVVVNGKIITVWTWFVGISVGFAVAISVIFLINNSRLLIVVVSTDLYLYFKPSSDSFDSVCIWLDYKFKKKKNVYTPSKTK